MLALLLLLPVGVGLLLWLVRKNYPLTLAAALLGALANLCGAVLVWRGGLEAALPVSALGFRFAFRADRMSALFLLLGAVLFTVLALYTAGYCRALPWGGQYQFWLWLSLSMLNGALLSDHLGLMLFFWEGLLCTLFGILLLRNHENPRTAVKALTISGAADLLLMLGIVSTVSAAGTGVISEISKLPTAGAGGLGCVCLLLGALGKAGCMPFHSWIPLAAEDAPTPFLAAFPGSLEKVAGIYLASRVITQLYAFPSGGGMSTFVCVLGSVTLLGGVMMALIQKDMKKLLAWHAISQVGYMTLGLGTGLAVGVAGGVFHLVNHAIYKTGLFMAAGAVEQQAGTTDLHRIGGLRKKMPLTTVCVIVFALAITGFPGLNGFFSKELIFDAALEVNVVYYLVALLGAFMTAASFLKLTRAAFWGPERAPQKKVRETSFPMAASELTLAALCVLCAVWNALPLGMIQKSFGLAESYSGLPKSLLMVLISCAVLGLAVLDHVLGAKKTGSALGAADHLHNAPGLRQFYAVAQKGVLDPYFWLTAAIGFFALVCRRIEDGVCWVYDRGVPGAVRAVGDALSRFDNGRLSRYLILALCGAAGVGLVFVIMLS